MYYYYYYYSGEGSTWFSPIHLVWRHRAECGGQPELGVRRAAWAWGAESTLNLWRLGFNLWWASHRSSLHKKSRPRETRVGGCHHPQQGYDMIDLVPLVASENLLHVVRPTLHLSNCHGWQAMKESGLCCLHSQRSVRHIHTIWVLLTQATKHEACSSPGGSAAGQEEQRICEGAIRLCLLFFQVWNWRL